MQRVYRAVESDTEAPRRPQNERPRAEAAELVEVRALLCELRPGGGADTNGPLGWSPLAPEPGHAAALADAQAQVAQLTRSRDGVRGMLSRVLERNRQGELVVGRLIARAPTDTEEGDVLEEGDTVPAVDPAAQGGA